MGTSGGLYYRKSGAVVRTDKEIITLFTFSNPHALFQSKIGNILHFTIFFADEVTIFLSYYGVTLYNI